jgi:hypothetical protein
MLLAPPVEQRVMEELPEPDLVPAVAPDVFSEEQWGLSDSLLQLDDMPRRLSGLLAEARRADPDLPRLVALRVLYALSPEIGVAIRQHDPRILLAVDDGMELDDSEFGGMDLLVGTALIEDLSLIQEDVA